MLLANMAVAHQIYRTYPELALLRRHPPPQSKMVDDLQEFCDQMGLDVDFSSSGALHVGISNYVNSIKNQHWQTDLQIQTRNIETDVKVLLKETLTFNRHFTIKNPT